MKSTFASHTFGSNTFASGNWTGVGVPVSPDPAECGTDFLAAGAAWLMGRMQAVASQPVIYQRGGQQVALCATFGRKLLRVSDDLGAMRIEMADQDFIIPRTSLELGGDLTLPRRGDRVVYDDGETVTTWEVSPVEDEPPFRWSDPFRKMVRIHAKRVSTEPA